MFLFPGAEITTYSAMCDGLALLEVLYDFQNICSFLCHCHFQDISIWATGGLLIGLYSSSAEGTGRDFSPSKHSRVCSVLERLLLLLGTPSAHFPRQSASSGTLSAAASCPVQGYAPPILEVHLQWPVYAGE